MKLNTVCITPGSNAESTNGKRSSLHSSPVCSLVVALTCALFITTACSKDQHGPSVSGSVKTGAEVGSGSDTFDGNGPLLDYTTNNASALPDVVRKDDRYHATLTDNDNDITLHFHKDQGRLDAKRFSFPFEFIARNIGIGTLDDSQVAPAPEDFKSPKDLYIFAGIQVHVLDLEKRDSAHFVVGHRGKTSYTVEGKNTRKGRSAVNDAGKGIVPDGRADLRVVGTKDRKLVWYWQQPNMDPVTQADNWIAYRGDGQFPGKQARFGKEVYIGLITYAFNEDSVPFVGTSDSIEWVNGNK